MRFLIYRYNPEVDGKPYMKEYRLNVERGMMLRDALKKAMKVIVFGILVVKVYVVLMP